MKKILVIKHGALGDLFFSLGAFEGIRKHFKDAHITLLTSSGFAPFGGLCPFFDDVLVDDRKNPLTHPLHNYTLLHTIKKRAFDLVIDLQRSSRTKKYMKALGLMGSLAPWCSIHKGAKYHLNVPSVYVDHILQINQRQLALLGMGQLPQGNLNWMDADISPLNVPKTFFILVPGTSPGQEHKKWPAAHYGHVAQHLYQKGLIPVVLGTKNEEKTLETMRKFCPQVHSLLGKTSIFQIPALARQAQGALGNDTGPLHACYFAECPTLYLFSHSSNPKFCGPLAPYGSVLKENKLDDLPVKTVINNIRLRS